VLVILPVVLLRVMITVSSSPAACLHCQWRAQQPPAEDAQSASSSSCPGFYSGKVGPCSARCEPQHPLTFPTAHGGSSSSLWFFYSSSWSPSGAVIFKLGIWDVTKAISMGQFILLQLSFDYGWPCSEEVWIPLALPCARRASSRTAEGWLVLTGRSCHWTRCSLPGLAFQQAIAPAELPSQQPALWSL